MSFLFGGGYKSQNSQYANQSQFQNQGTTTTTRNLLPGASSVLNPLFSRVNSMLTDPAASLDPARLQARNRVNANYSGVFDKLRQQFFSNGAGGNSGKFGNAALQADLARRGDLSDVDTSFAAMIPQQYATWAQLAAQLLGLDTGTTTTAQQSGTEVGSGSGSQSGWGINFGLGGR